MLHFCTHWQLHYSCSLALSSFFLTMGVGSNLPQACEEIDFPPLWSWLFLGSDTICRGSSIDNGEIFASCCYTDGWNLLHQYHVCEIYAIPSSIADDWLIGHFSSRLCSHFCSLRGGGHCNLPWSSCMRGDGRSRCMRCCSLYKACCGHRGTLFLGRFETL